MYGTVALIGVIESFIFWLVSTALILDHILHIKIREIKTNFFLMISVNFCTGCKNDLKI